MGEGNREMNPAENSWDFQVKHFLILALDPSGFILKHLKGKHVNALE